MKPIVIALALLSAVSTALVAPRAAVAQEVEVSGPLAGAPAVIGLRVYREMRLQAQLQASTTLTDEYSQTMLVGGQLMFHPTDWLGIGAWGGFALANIDTKLTDEVAAKGQTNENNVVSLPDASRFSEQIGQINWVGALQAHFIPLRGKLGIFESLFVDTDFYLVGGVAFVGLEERVEVDGATCSGDTLSVQRSSCAGTIARESRTALAPTFGVGLSMYMADFLALTLEWRALPFAWNTSGTDEAGDVRGNFPDGNIDSEDQLPHFNHMFSLGFAFYLPTEPGRSYAEEEEGSE